MNLDESFGGSLILELNLVAQGHQLDELVDVEHSVLVYVDLGHEEGEFIFCDFCAHIFDGEVELSNVEETRPVDISFQEYLLEFLSVFLLGHQLL